MALLSIANGASAASHSALLISGFAPIGPRSGAKPTADASAASDEAGLARLEELLASLKEQAESAARGSSGGARAQHAVDQMLAEIGDLLGEPLTLGGAENAVVEGLDSAQIASYTVRSLRPNASAKFGGSVTTTESAARLALPDFASLRAAGGRLEFAGAGGYFALDVHAGESASSVASRVNSIGRGALAAQAADGELRLVARSETGPAFLHVVQRENAGGAGFGPAEVSGANSAQVAGIDVGGVTPGTAMTISGSRMHGARGAELSYQGAGGVATGSATFRLRGADGETTFAVADGESLAAIAQRINDATDNTGVTARVAGDRVVLQSVAVGAAAKVAIDQVQRASFTTLSEIDEAQIESFAIVDRGDAEEVTLAGTVTQTADRARLTYHGSGGLVVGSADFTLRGGLGSMALSVTTGESLAAVAQRINDASVATGVTATVAGDDLKLSSVDVNSAAFVRVHDVTRDADVTVSGANVGQFADVDVLAIADGAEVTLTGTITQAAATARQVYHGAAGALGAGSATFRLTGELGSVDVSIDDGESLAAVAQRINDATATTGVAAAVVGNNLELLSSNESSDGLVQVDNIVRDVYLHVTGVNAAQITGFNVVSIPDGAAATLTGSITQAADFARQTYHGGSGAVVVDTATFQLSGASGSAQVNITQGESLASVARRINGLSGTTGVVATTQGNNLVFASAAVGSSQSVRVQLQSVAQYVNVSGVNGAQITQFQVASAAPASTNVLNGAVTRAATRGTLSYTGFLNATTSAATFTLTGAAGSAVISVSGLQSLSSVRTAINARTADTGVVAGGSGNTLTLTSVGYGSVGGVVDVHVTSGTFNTTGGNGAGHAVGLDALATVNGSAVTGAGNNLSYTNALGSYNFTLAAGFTGALSTVTVTSANGAFNVTGGDGSGTSYGVDARATLNGNALTAAGNHFATTIDNVAFNFDAVQGFTGAINPISVSADFDAFDVTGGDGAGRAYGRDAEATINGQALVGAGRTLHATIDGVEVTLETAAGATGAFDPISIASIYDPFDVSGGNLTGAAYGRDAAATINGQAYSAVGRDFTIFASGGEFAFTVAEGFIGALTPIVIGTEYDEFSFTGGNELGVAAGQDGLAIINGVETTSGTDRFEVETDRGRIAIEFHDSFVGTFDPLEVAYATLSTTPQRSRTYFDAGSESTLRINGREIEQDNGQYVLREGGVEIALRFAEGFSGELKAFKVSAAGKSATRANGKTPLSEEAREPIAKEFRDLFSLATGGEYATASSRASRALDLVLNALARLEESRGGSPLVAQRSLGNGGFDLRG